MRKILVAIMSLVAALLGTLTAPPLDSVRIVEALSTPSGALSPSPANHAYSVARTHNGGPSNWDFGSGSSNWTIIGDASKVSFPGSGGQSGAYASFANNGPWLESMAFTVPSTANNYAVYLNVSSGFGQVYVASGAGYTTLTQKVSQTGTSGQWVRKVFSLSSFSGQSIKIRYRVFSGAGGFDEGHVVDELPGWSGGAEKALWVESASIPATTPSAGDYTGSEVTCSGGTRSAATVPAAQLTGNTSITSQEFTIPSDGFINLHFTGTGPTNGFAQVRLTLASEGHATLHYLYNKSFPTGQGVFTSCGVSQWSGQKAKISAQSLSGQPLTVADGGLGTSFNASLDPARAGDPVSTITGALTHHHTDVAIPGKGMSLEFSRAYSSADANVPTDLGFGWTHNYDSNLVIYNNGSVLVRYPGGAEAFYKLVSGTLTPPRGLNDVLVKNVDNSYTLTTAVQTKLEFSAAGKLTALKDRNANTTTLAYNGSGYLSTVTDPGGRTLTFTTDGSGRITQVQDPLSRTVGFAYDSNGDLVTVTDVKGGTATYTYDQHRFISLTDSLSHTQNTNIYDAHGRVAEQTDAVNGTTCFYYGSGATYTSATCGGVSPAAVPGQTIMVDPRGGKHTYQYDTSFRLTDYRNPLDEDTLYTYEATGALCSPANNGNMCSVTDPLNHNAAFTYDSKGNVLTRTDADNKTWTYTYNSLNQVLTATDPLTRVTTNTYDTAGNLTSTTNALSQVTTFTPNSDGTVASVTDPLSHTTSFTYDTKGNVLTKTDALSHTWTYTYDLGGRLLTETDPLSHTTTYTYDNQNNVLSVQDALGNVSKATYNAKGLQTGATGANRAVVGTAESGSACGTAGTGNDVDDDSDGKKDDGCPNTLTSYDNADRVTSVVDALGNSLSYTYDANGNRVTMTNPRGKVTAYTYDLANRMTKEKDPLDRETVFTYDAAGRRTTRTDARSLTTNYSYDVVNRLTGVDYPVGTSDVTYTYDALGNRLTMADGTGTTTWTRDALYRPTSVTDGASHVIGYAYDSAGQLTTLTYPGGSSTVTYGYDNANRLTSVTDWQSKVTTYTYDNANRLTSATLGNGLIADRTYDNAGRLLTLTNRNGGTTISSYTYTLDAIGNRTQRADSLGTESYTYDRLYRLTGVTYGNGDTQSYTFDAQGNRLTKVHNGTTTTSTYDDADQLATAGGVTYTHDNAGNQTGAGSDTFTWDAENRLTATSTGGTTGSYSYNGDGLRMSRIIGGSTVGYIWDQSGGLPNVLQDSAGNRYVYGLDLISTEAPGGALTYYLYDGLGSTTGLTNAAGTVTGGYTYDVYGTARSQTGATTEWNYTGEQNDPTGLEYLRARYYDKVSGRFLSQDPLPTGEHYTYAGNNPGNFNDPSGECRVDVRSKELPYKFAVTFRGRVLYEYTPSHLYIVSYDPSGSSLAYRVGPSHGISGNMSVVRGPWRKGFPDWDGHEDHKSRTVLDNKESCQRYWDAFDEVADFTGNRTYSFLQRNSNSFVRALLSNALLPEKKPGGHHPGWGNDLGY